MPGCKLPMRFQPASPSLEGFLKGNTPTSPSPKIHEPKSEFMVTVSHVGRRRCLCPPRESPLSRPSTSLQRAGRAPPHAGQSCVGCAQPSTLLSGEHQSRGRVPGDREQGLGSCLL